MQSTEQLDTLISNIYTDGQRTAEQLQKQNNLQMLGLSLIVVRNKVGKFLAVREINKRGWWLPGGKVDPPEDFITAATRETKEEAGIDIVIKGILRIEQDIGMIVRLKVIFYAEPIDETQIPKQIPDQESEEARWVTLTELKELGKHPPYLRGTELSEFGEYLQKGGLIYPLSILQTSFGSSSDGN